MERDPFPPAEFMEEGEPLFDWEEDALSKRHAPRRDIGAGASVSAEAAQHDSRAPSWWERVTRGI